MWKSFLRILWTSWHKARKFKHSRHYRSCALYSILFALQTERGIGQAKGAGKVIKDYIQTEGQDNKLYFYMSPYKRSLQTFEALASNFSRDQIQGCQEEVQLREQDFGNFQVRRRCMLHAMTTLITIDIQAASLLVLNDFNAKGACLSLQAQAASIKCACLRERPNPNVSTIY